jgi:hypothetical protein
MTSIQVRISRRLLRLLFASWSKNSIAEQRAKQETQTRFTRLPRHLFCQPVTVNGIPSEWIALPGADSRIMLYLHGGGYCLGSINASRSLIARLVEATKRTKRTQPTSPSRAANDSQPSQSPNCGYSVATPAVGTNALCSWLGPEALLSIRPYPSTITDQPPLRLTHHRHPVLHGAESGHLAVQRVNPLPVGGHRQQDVYILRPGLGNGCRESQRPSR